MFRAFGTILLGVATVPGVGCGSDGASDAPDAQVQQDAAAPDSGPAPGTWTLNGTIRGINLQDDARSATSGKVDDGTSVRTSVTLINLDNWCALNAGDPSCPGQGTPRRFMLVTILGTQPGTYPVTSGNHLDPPSGESGVSFIALGEDCQLLSPTLEAESGSVTFSAIDLTPGGEVSFTFNVSTTEGPVSGNVTAPYCP